MFKFFAALIVMGAVSVACASESKLSIEIPKNPEEDKRGVAQVQEVERPESLKYESEAAKDHREYQNFINRHYNRFR